jgi:hypothetical protein
MVRRIAGGGGGGAGPLVLSPPPPPGSAPPKKSKGGQKTLDMFRSFDAHTERFSKLEALRLESTPGAGTPVKVLLTPGEVPDPGPDPGGGGEKVEQRSIAGSIADQSSFLMDEGDDDDGAPEEGEGEEADFSTNPMDFSTSSLTGALLAAHRKNRFLEEELKQEKLERLAVAKTIKDLQVQVQEEITSSPPPTQDQRTLGAAAQSLDSLAHRALSAESTAAALQSELASATSNFALQASMASKEREILLADIAVMKRSSGLINDVSKDMGWGVRQRVEEVDAVLRKEVGSKREEVAASIVSGADTTVAFEDTL